ncbi:hypothetical protein T4C_11464 [Trichinella pseudospiralis]|uniref:Uncharacterized protein n=1 Tax=Trichinella pseudospiralis TaxID=6337 RepID=A0A0V1IGK9_TRIPS|nr:hypothetical protein T4C_11464 [Trichinella pseudospiralis]
MAESSEIKKYGRKNTANILIAKSLTRRLECKRPITDKQSLYPWLIRHFDGCGWRWRCEAKVQEEKTVYR